MKRITLLMLIALTAVYAQARRVIWDVRAGIGMSQLLYDNRLNLGSMSAYKAAVDLTVPTGYKGFFFFPVEYTKKGGTIKELDKTLWEATYVQTGFQFGYRIGISYFDLRLRMGPYIALTVDELDGDIGLGYEETGCINTHDVDAGVTVGMDFEYTHYLLGVEYQRTLMGMPATMKGWKLANSAIYVTLGYRF